VGAGRVAIGAVAGILTPRAGTGSRSRR
jgi:hypothetical protein